MAEINEKEKYCSICGTAFEVRTMDGEGQVQYCPTCKAWHFPAFNTACSMITVDTAAKKILLIKQYGRPDYILVAGYVNRGENAEQTAARELMEEVGLTPEKIQFNRSRFFRPSNTLMLNFTMYVPDGTRLKVNREVDSYAWFTFEEAKKNIKPNSLAREFLLAYLSDCGESV